MADCLWELCNPDGNMLGMEVGCAIMEADDTVLGHALPEREDIEFRDQAGNSVARDREFKADQGTTIAQLSIRDETMQREQVWPGQSDLKRPVIPGGEVVGILKTWWNAADGSEWRWQAEFHNHV